MMIEPDKMPDVESIIDPVSGYAVNVPLGLQEKPEFWEQHPEIVARLYVMRVIAGIMMDERDDFPKREMAEASTDTPTPEALTVPSRRRASPAGMTMSGKGADLQGDIDFLRRLMETKSGKRFVRSAEGARRFGKPIGSLITREDREKAREKNSGGKKTPSSDGAGDAKISAALKGGNLDDFGDLSDRKLSEGITEKVRAAKVTPSGVRWGFYMPTKVVKGGRVVTSTYDQTEASGKQNFVTTYVATRDDNGMSGSWTIQSDSDGNLTSVILQGSDRAVIQAQGNDEETMRKLIEASARSLKVKPNQRLVVNSDEYDEDGKWHRNRRPRDYDGLVELNEGIRGWDYQVDPSEADIDWKSYEARMELARKEAAELGYTIGELPFYEYGGAAKIDMPVMEHINGVMRTFEDMYPGFGQLVDSIGMFNPRKSQAIAWNGQGPQTVETGEMRQWSGMGFNAKFFSNTAKARRELLMLAGVKPENIQGSKEAQEADLKREAAAAAVDGAATFHAVPPAALMEAYGWDATRAVTTMIATHEIGHTVGNIIQGALYRNGRMENKPSPDGSSDSVADFHRRRMLEIFEDYGFVPKGTADNTPAGTSARWMNIGKEGFNPASDPFDRKAITEHLSAYGATNVSEIMAETWAAYQLHPNPGDFVREMGELMEAALQDFLAEEEPEKRFKKKAVRVIRSENNATMPTSGPDFSGMPLGQVISVPTDAGTPLRFARRGDPQVSSGYGRGRVANVVSVNPPKITFVERTVNPETQLYDRKPGPVHVWDDIQGWVPEEGAEQ